MCRVLVVCPLEGWELHKEPILQKDEVCRALLDNKERYSNACGYVQETHAARKCFTGIGSNPSCDGVIAPMVASQLAKALQQLAASGVELVCSTYAVFYTRKEFPTYSAEKVS